MTPDPHKPVAANESWRELYRTSDRRELLAIAISIAAMEFPVRCVDLQGNVVTPSEYDPAGPVAVQVFARDHGALLDVLDEIIREQAEFDVMLEQKQRQAIRTRQGALLIAMIVVVTLLATLGLVEL